MRIRDLAGEMLIGLTQTVAASTATILAEDGDQNSDAGMQSWWLIKEIF